jgi:hypothetical protein
MDEVLKMDWKWEFIEEVSKFKEIKSGSQNLADVRRTQRKMPAILRDFPKFGPFG